jgi:hypothetical protein
MSPTQLIFIIMAAVNEQLLLAKSNQPVKMFTVTHAASAFTNILPQLHVTECWVQPS